MGCRPAQSLQSSLFADWTEQQAKGCAPGHAHGQPVSPCCLSHHKQAEAGAKGGNMRRGKRKGGGRGEYSAIKGVGQGWGGGGGVL